jgi:hypothetical protein
MCSSKDTDAVCTLSADHAHEWVMMAASHPGRGKTPPVTAESVCLEVVATVASFTQNTQEVGKAKMQTIVAT